MFGKIEITGKITVLTGMHIGASDSFSAIGAIDSPVIRDAVTDLPLIPGSSLKGKMRTLLAKSYNEKWPVKHDEDDEKILRLFGCSRNKTNGNPQFSRLIFSDAIMDNFEDLKKVGIKTPTEAKEENTINRLTAVANPRQIERTIRGAEFPLCIVYEAVDEDTIIEDFTLIAEGIKLLEYDYIGGHGSRGYGKIKFSELDAQLAIGDIDDSVIGKCQTILKEVK